MEKPQPTRTPILATTSLSIPRGRDYDPWEHAELLGIPVFVRRLRTANGIWFPEYGEIIISDRLRARDQRLTLAHEIGHGVLAHRDDRPKHERQADQYAAKNLICPNELAEIYEWASDEHEIISELGVTRTLLRAYMSAA